MPGTVFVYVPELYRVLLSPVYFRLRIPRLVQIAVPVALQLSTIVAGFFYRVRFGQLV